MDMTAPRGGDGLRQSVGAAAGEPQGVAVGVVRTGVARRDAVTAPGAARLCPTRTGRSAARLALLGGTMLALAACATTGQPGAAPGMAGGFTNPLAGLWGRMPVVGTATPAGGSAAASGAVVDPFAGQGVSQPDIPPAGSVKATATPKPAATTPVAPADSAAGTAPAAKANPATHTVAAGETAWSIARKYGVTIAALAEANKLPAETMTVRIGQKLAIPAGGTTTATPTATVTAPGSGSPTPEPPSASKPLPREGTKPANAPVAKPEAPDLGATRTKASGNGKFQMPVAGSIVRAYAKGKNDGIDISAPTGTTVKAAGSGTVAAITRDTEGVPIVVVRHQGQLMTVYSGLDALNVAKGDKVSAGESLGKSGKSGVLHFEVRQGFDSVDPEGYLR